MLFPKSFAYMISNSGECKVINFKNQEAGILNVEIIPCNGQGVPIAEKDRIVIHDPKVELLNKNVNFIIKINSLKNVAPNYEVYLV